MADLRFVLLLSIAALAGVGCHQANQASQQQQQPVVVPVAPTATADKTQIRSDQSAAQTAMQSDAAALRSAMAAPAATVPDSVAAGMVAVAHITPSKSATTLPVNNNVSGIVTFTQEGNKVLVVADVSGLEPSTRHGIDVYERGDLSDPSLMSAGATGILITARTAAISEISMPTRTVMRIWNPAFRLFPWAG